MPDLFGQPTDDEVRLGRINADRKRHGKPPLTVDEAIEHQRLCRVYEKTLDAGERERARVRLTELDRPTAAPATRRRFADLLPGGPAAH